MARHNDYDTEEFGPGGFGDDYDDGDGGFDGEIYAGEYDEGAYFGEEYIQGYVIDPYGADGYPTDDGFDVQPALIYTLQPADPPGPGTDDPGPSPGCITLATLLICTVVAALLLRVAAGISHPAGQALVDTAAEVYQTAVAPQAPDVSADAIVSPGSEAASAACQVSNLFPEKVLRWCSLISFYAGRHDLNPDLVAAVVWLESGGDELAYSRSGAVGLMQVMPSDGLATSFMCINGPCFSDRPTTAELQDPEFNLAYGTRMLAGLLRKNGNLREALRSYGPMNVGYYYSDKVLGLFEKYRTVP